MLERDRQSPLSFAQEWMWLLQQLDPESTAYSSAFMYRVQGPLCVQRLREALAGVVQRHETLRASFSARRGLPVQTISSDCEVALDYVDLAAFGRAPARRGADDLLRGQVSQPFDLDKAPLARTAVVRVGVEEFRLLLTFHHIIVDTWSAGVFLHDLLTLYEADPANASSRLPPLTSRYTDVAAAQRERYEGPEGRVHREYWRQQLGDVRPAELPTDFPRTASPPYLAGDVKRTIADVGGLRRIAQRDGATVFMCLLAAWHVLMAFHTRREDSIVGVVEAGRSRPDTEPLVGCFINVFPARVDLRGTISFRQLLCRVRDSSIEAYGHSDVPFVRLVQELRPARAGPQSPYFDTVLSHFPQPARIEMAGIRLTPCVPKVLHTDLPITLYLRPADSGMLFWMVFRTDLFRRRTAELILGRYVALLDQIAKSPDASISALLGVPPSLGRPPQRDVTARIIP